MSNESNNPLDTQVGGDHYKHFKIQPIEFIIANRIEGAESYVIKYVCRWRNKNGVEDLRKARHTLDIMIQEEEAATERQHMRSTAFVRPHQEDAEWPKVGDVCFTWASNATGGTYQTTWQDSSTVLSGWLEDGALFRTREEAEAEWHKRYGKKQEPVASEPVTLNADEMAMVANGQMIDAEMALWVRSRTIGRHAASAIVDAYRASIKASEPPVEHVAIKPPCPTGVPENGEWMPGYGEIYWDAAYGVSCPWGGGTADLRSLAGGDVCRTREIARTVQRRRTQKEAAK